MLFRSILISHDRAFLDSIVSKTLAFENGKVNVTLEIERKRGLKQNIRDIIVAIDAGHGGKDPGAVSKNNLLEKDLTLLKMKLILCVMDFWHTR